MRGLRLRRVIMAAVVVLIVAALVFVVGLVLRADGLQDAANVAQLVSIPLAAGPLLVAVMLWARRPVTRATDSRPPVPSDSAAPRDALREGKAVATGGDSRPVASGGSATVGARMAGPVFLSYARVDGAEHAQLLEDRLREAGFETWRDTSDQDISQDFGVQIEIAIRACRAIVVCVTGDAVRSDSFVRREIAYAQLERRPIVVARFTDVTPPIAVVTHPFVDFLTEDFDTPLRLLVEFLRTGSGAVAVLQVPERAYLEALYREVVAALEETVTLALGNRRGELLELAGTLVRPGGTANQDVLSPRFRRAASRIPNAGVHEAFRSGGGRLAVVGGPGSGKTTTMLGLTRDLASAALAVPGQPLPVLIPAATWGVTEPDELPVHERTPDARARDTTVRDWIHRQVPALPETAREADIVLLVDGLDEVPRRTGDSDANDDAFRDVFVAQLAAVASVVVSSRPAAFEEANEQLGLRMVFELQPLSDGQIDDFARGIPGVERLLRADAGAHEIARTPLMLAMLCSSYDLTSMSHRGTGTAHEARDVVMRDFLATRYERESADHTMSESDLVRRLGELAMDDAVGGGNRNLMRPIEVQRVLGDDGLALALAMHVLVPVGRGSMRFFHAAMRDHLAFHQAVLAATSDDGEDRDRAAWALWQNPDPRVLPVLLGMLNDPYSYARGSAAGALGRLGDPRALPELRGLLSDETEVTSMYGSSIRDVAQWAIRCIEESRDVSQS